MVERLMHEIHFAVGPNSNSKKQALDVIRELQRHFPIKEFSNETAPHCSCSKLSLAYGELKEWDASVVSKDESGTQMSTGRLEILAVSVHAEGDTSMDHYDEHDDMALQTHKPLLPADETEPKHLTETVNELSKKMQKQEIGTTGNIKQEGGEEKKGTKCSTCNTFVGEAKQYREHCKSDWHKHNLKRKTRKLPPLTAEEYSSEIDMDDSKADLKDYSF